VPVDLLAVRSEEQRGSRLAASLLAGVWKFLSMSTRDTQQRKQMCDVITYQIALGIEMLK